MTWHFGSNDPFGDPGEAAAFARLLEAVALLGDDQLPIESDWLVVPAPDVLDGEDQQRFAREVLAVHGDVLVDLSATSLLTARGSRALHDLHHAKALTGHTVALKGATGIVRQVIDITGLGTVVPVLGA